MSKFLLIGGVLIFSAYYVKLTFEYNSSKEQQETSIPYITEEDRESI